MSENSTNNDIQEKDQEMQVCCNHPNRQTLLHCNQCLRPICLDCAVLTPTGYRCKDCVNQQQKKFNTSISRDYLIAALISGGISLIGSQILNYIRMVPFILGLILAPSLGTLIVNLVRRATQHRRSDDLNRVTVAAAAIGAALPVLNVLWTFVRSLLTGQFSVLLSGSLFIGWEVFYIVALCGTIWSEMKGMRFSR